MAETLYTYSIANDTLNGEVASAGLYNEIMASNITIALSRIDTEGDDLKIYFKTALASSEETILDGLVANHTGINEADDSVVIHENLSEVGGWLRMKSVKIAVPANSDAYVDTTWPYNIRLKEIKFKPKTTGDKIEGLVAPDTVIGAITADVAAGAVVIHVQDTVVDNVHIGFFLTIDDGANSERHQVVAIDYANHTVTIDEGLTNSYAAAAPAYCKMSVGMSDGPMELDSLWMCTCGADVIGGSLIQKGTVFRLHYWNTSADAVEIIFKLTYWY